MIPRLELATHRLRTSSPATLAMDQHQKTRNDWQIKGPTQSIRSISPCLQHRTSTAQENTTAFRIDMVGHLTCAFASLDFVLATRSTNLKNTTLSARTRRESLFWAGHWWWNPWTLDVEVPHPWLHFSGKILQHSGPSDPGNQETEA